jgi:hypothetical protein
MCMTIECPECGAGIRITRIEAARKPKLARTAAQDWLHLETKAVPALATADGPDGRTAPEAVCSDGCDGDCNCGG